MISMLTKSKSSLTPRGRIAPLHPSEVLREEFMIAMGLSVEQLAQELGVINIADVVKEQSAITRDIAERLASRFGTTAEFWMNMQVRYEASVAADARKQRVPRRASHSSG